MVFEGYPYGDLPSGKLSHNSGKSPSFTGKSLNKCAIFNSYVANYQRICSWMLDYGFSFGVGLQLCWKKC